MKLRPVMRDDIGKHRRLVAHLGAGARFEGIVKGLTPTGAIVDTRRIDLGGERGWEYLINRSRGKRVYGEMRHVPQPMVEEDNDGESRD